MQELVIVWQVALAMWGLRWALQRWEGLLSVAETIFDIVLNGLVWVVLLLITVGPMWLFWYSVIRAATH